MEKILSSHSFVRSIFHSGSSSCCCCCFNFPHPIPEPRLHFVQRFAQLLRWKAAIFDNGQTVQDTPGNSYKALMMSNYVFQPTYTTEWKSLAEMKGFAPIFLRDLIYEYDWVLWDQDIVFRSEMKRLCNPEEHSLYKNTCVHAEESTQWQDSCHYLYGRRPGVQPANSSGPSMR